MDYLNIIIYYVLQLWSSKLDKTDSDCKIISTDLHFGGLDAFSI